MRGLEASLPRALEMSVPSGSSSLLVYQHKTLLRLYNQTTVADQGAGNVANHARSSRLGTWCWGMHLQSSIREEDVGGPGIQGHLWLQSKVQADPACMRPLLKQHETKHTRHTNTPMCSHIKRLIYGHLFVFMG